MRYKILHEASALIPTIIFPFKNVIFASKRVVHMHCIDRDTDSGTSMFSVITYLFRNFLSCNRHILYFIIALKYAVLTITYTFCIHLWKMSVFFFLSFSITDLKHGFLGLGHHGKMRNANNSHVGSL